MPSRTYSEARTIALVRLMRADERIIVLGGHVGRPNAPALTVPPDLAHRTRRLPNGELGCGGIAIGAAATGLRPIVTWATASVMFNAWPEIINEAANYHYVSGGQVRVPVVFHMSAGIRGHLAAQRSHSPQAMFWNTPGLEIVMPSTPRDIAGLLPSVFASDNPTVLIDHEALATLTEEFDDEPDPIPMGQADVKRAGKDVTIVAFSIMVHRALEAADALARNGVEVEVVDPRTLVPLDKEAILRSVAKTGRLVIADECHRSCGVAAGLASIVAEEGFSSLRAPIRIVATPDVPVPYSPAMEAFVIPSAARIIAAVEDVLRA